MREETCPRGTIRKRRLLIAPLFLALVCGPFEAHALEIRISSSALEKAVTTQLFAEGEKHNLIPYSTCKYAFLEYPKVEIVDGRVSVGAHLSFRDAPGDTCLGGGGSTDIRMSAVPTVSGTVLGLADLRLEEPRSGWYSLLLEAFVGTLAKGPLSVDLAGVLKKGAADAGYDLDTSRLVLSGVSAANGGISITIDGGVAMR